MAAEDPKTFVEHLEEMRRLMMQPFFVMAIVAGLAFWQSHAIINLLQKPLSQTLYYSSPMGGFSFVFQVAVICGLLAGLPLFVRSVIKFLEPVMAKLTKRRMFAYLISSILLAGTGVYLGYVISLPAALRFLNGFETGTLKPLIAADQYLRFAMTYLGGFALLFQLPLIILIINRIKPLKPSRLMRQQRYVIAGSFVIAAILTPTPDAVNQLIFAAPMIILYQISIGLVAVVNARQRQKVRRAVVPEPVLNAPTEPVLPRLSLDDLEDDWGHPVGALYTPMPGTTQYALEPVEPEPPLRPIDVVLAHTVTA